jgi:hypothetical protein
MKINLVKTLIFPIFYYCDTVYNDLTLELANKLQRAQNYCIKFIFNSRWFDHITEYYESLLQLKLKESRKYHILMILYSVLNCKQPLYLVNKFAYTGNISMRNTRHGSHLLNIPTHHSNFDNKSFVITAARLWNTLPNDIRDCNTKARFGASLKWFLSADSWGM